MAIQKNFGFYPYRKSFKTTGILIEPVSDLQIVIEDVLVENRIYDGWFYPPLVRHRATKNSVVAPLKPTTTPDTPTTRFSLPSTHTFSHRNSDNEEQVNFLIVSLGFLLGLRLVPEPWGHFYRTPVEEHKLSDLIVGTLEAEHCLDSFDAFYANARPKLRSSLWSAINTFQMAQCYEHQFEEFFFQYVTLDAVYHAFLANGWVKTVKHGTRPKVICEHLGIILPDWAEIDANGNSQVSNVRNNLFHEGVVARKPIGFDVIRPTSILLEMQALNMRAILFLMGVDMPYVHSRVTTRQMHGLG